MVTSVRLLFSIIVAALVLFCGPSLACYTWITSPSPEVAGWYLSTPDRVVLNGGQAYDCGTLESGTMDFRIGRELYASHTPRDFDILVGLHLEEELHYQWKVYKKNAQQQYDLKYTHTLDRVDYCFAPYLNATSFGDADGNVAGDYLIQWIAWDMGKHSGEYFVEAQDWPSENPGHGEFLVTVVDSGEGRLPTTNLNGVNRCNIRWAQATSTTADLNIGYGDDFTLPAGKTWVIDKIRVWAVLDVPMYPTYHVGDHFESIILYGGLAAGSLGEKKSATLATGSNSSGDVTATAVSYSGGVNYKCADGRENQIWQVDFSNLNWSVTGGTAYAFGVRGVPRVDRLWFLHATNSELAGWSGYGDNKVRRFDLADLNEEVNFFDPLAAWLGRDSSDNVRGSDINVQVFAHEQ